MTHNTSKRITEILAAEELIGLHIRVIGSANRHNINKSGKIIDETTKTIVIESGGKKKKLIKSVCEFELHTRKYGTVKFNGNLITHDPVKRIKKHGKKNLYR